METSYNAHIQLLTTEDRHTDRQTHAQTELLAGLSRARFSQEQRVEGG